LGKRAGKNSGQGDTRSMDRWGASIQNIKAIEKWQIPGNGLGKKVEVRFEGGKELRVSDRSFSIGVVLRVRKTRHSTSEAIKPGRLNKWEAGGATPLAKGETRH